MNMLEALGERIKYLRNNQDSPEMKAKLEEALNILEIYEAHLEREKEKAHYLYDY